MSEPAIRAAPHAVFRADASAAVGTGHLMRCRTLAASLVARGWRATFLARDLDDTLSRGLVARGIAVRALPPGVPIASEPRLIAQALPSDVSLVVGDHYGLFAEWYEAVGRSRPEALLMAIDDLADRPLPVDLVLNQNLGSDPRMYRHAVPQGALVITGPMNALLRPEFATIRARERPRDGAVERILVFMGGGDATDVTAKALVGLRGLGRAVDVAVGAAYPHLDRLRAIVADLEVANLHVDTDSMPTLMDRADLAVGAVGSASWERCALGLPAVVVTLADNQIVTQQALVEAGAVEAIGWHTSVTATAIGDAVGSLCADPDRLVRMSAAAAAITDGRGTERVVTAIEMRMAAGRSEAT